MTPAAKWEPLGSCLALILARISTKLLRRSLNNSHYRTLSQGPMYLLSRLTRVPSTDFSKDRTTTLLCGGLRDHLATRNSTPDATPAQVPLSSITF